MSRSWNCRSRYPSLDSDLDDERRAIESEALGHRVDEASGVGQPRRRVRREVGVLLEDLHRIRVEVEFGQPTPLAEHHAERVPDPPPGQLPPASGSCWRGASCRGRGRCGRDGAPHERQDFISTYDPCSSIGWSTATTRSSMRIPDPREQDRGALARHARHPVEERRSRLDREAGEPDDQIDSADSTVSPGDERSRSVAIVRGPLTSAQPIAGSCDFRSPSTDTP